MKRESTMWDKFLIPIITGTIATVVGGIILFQLTASSLSDATPTRITQSNPTLVLPTNTTVPTIASYTPTLGIVSKISADGATMMFVAAGEFLMGSSDVDKEAQANEKPQHKVYIDAFWMDKFEVTNALYKKCVDAQKCSPPWESKTFPRSAYYSNSQYANYPVIYMSWNDARAYCDWAGKRLPTEAEWEKAARGTDDRFFPWGNLFDKHLLNSTEGGKGDITAVGTYLKGASPYGVQDMLGNVWEWVADWYDENYYRNSPVRNPSGPDSGNARVLRGGSWYNYSGRVTTRNGSNLPNYRSDVMGFRCAQ